MLASILILSLVRASHIDLHRGQDREWSNAAKRNRCGFPILKRAIARYDLVLGLNRISGRVKSRPRAIPSECKQAKSRSSA